MTPELIERLDEIIRLSGKRTEKVLTTFPNGYAHGWRMQIPKAFSDALDLSSTEKVIDGEKRTVWTQGCQFRFKEGDLVHDVSDGYLPTWGDSIKRVTLSVQVARAVAATTGASRDPGLLEFRVLRPCKDKAKMELHETIVGTQDSFVRFLLTGSI